MFIDLPKKAKENLTGRSFGRLVVLGPVEIKRYTGTARVIWLCRCECGSTARVPTSNLKNGNSTSCGCAVPEKCSKANTRHGMCKKRTSVETPEYRCWRKMRERCCNPLDKSYADYGGRGIRVCAEWMDSFEAFFAHIGPKPSPAHSIDRINVNGNYEPGNVRWATAIEQAANKRPKAA
jgi:hypothetical protein